MSLAEKCYDMRRGVLMYLPEAGGVWDQNDLLMTLIRVARKTWLVYMKRQAGEKWTPDDAEFMALMGLTDGAN